MAAACATNWMLKPQVVKDYSKEFLYLFLGAPLSWWPVESSPFNAIFGKWWHFTLDWWLAQYGYILKSMASTLVTPVALRTSMLLTKSLQENAKDSEGTVLVKRLTGLGTLEQGSDMGMNVLWMLSQLHLSNLPQIQLALVHLLSTLITYIYNTYPKWLNWWAAFFPAVCSVDLFGGCSLLEMQVGVQRKLLVFWMVSSPKS